MRTPLNNLMGHTELAHRTDDCQALLVSSQEEYEHLARMTDNMLFLARAGQPDRPCAASRRCLMGRV